MKEQKEKFDIDQWRANLEHAHRFTSFWSNVSQIKVEKTADPHLVARLVEASERVK